MNNVNPKMAKVCGQLQTSIIELGANCGYSFEVYEDTFAIRLYNDGFVTRTGDMYSIDDLWDTAKALSALLIDKLVGSFVSTRDVYDMHRQTLLTLIQFDVTEEFDAVFRIKSPNPNITTGVYCKDLVLTVERYSDKLVQALRSQEKVVAEINKLIEHAETIDGRIAVMRPIREWGEYALAIDGSSIKQFNSLNYKVVIDEVYATLQAKQDAHMVGWTNDVFYADELRDIRTSEGNKE